MVRFILFVAISILLAVPTRAQQDSLPPTEWSLAYVGNNLWHPGLQAGYYHHGRGHRGVPRVYQAQLGFFWDPQAQFNVFAFGGWHFRAEFDRFIDRINFRISPLGIFRSFYPEAFEVQADGSTKKLFLPGRWYYAPEAQIELSYKLKGPLIDQLYIGPQLILLLPYDGRSLPLLNLQMGLIFNSQP
ncbi:MAG: hypothetical protein AAFQ87_18110 [Bacteroidota bacterium]